MGQAKLRAAEIATLKNFDNIVDDFVAKRQRYNRYGGDIGRVRNIRRMPVGRPNKCIDNAQQYFTDNVGPACGWLILLNPHSNFIEVTPHMWNIDFKRNIQFDTTPIHSSIQHYAYVWDSDMYLFKCDHKDDDNYRTLPGVCYIENGNVFSVIDMEPITGEPLQVKKLDTFKIDDFNWFETYINIYDSI
jgi:hypothetical protein